MHINLFLRPFGNHHAQWRHPDISVTGSLAPEKLIEQAQTAERGLFDSVFLADSPGLGDNPWNHLLGPFEPLTLLGAIAARTSRIGLIGTASTSYNEPYNVARSFASLDYISGGRAGWNVVTSASASAAPNFGHSERAPHAERYARATEHVEVVAGLWSTWAPDAIVADKEAGVLVDPERLHTLDHEGKYFRVRGPLDIPPSPQGRPVIVQAGSSPDGRGLAARYAEAVFTAQETTESGIAFAEDLRERAVALGRDGDDIVILPGLSPLLAETETEARRISDELHRLNIVDAPLAVLSDLVGFPLSGYEPDTPFPAEKLVDPATFEGHASRYGQIHELVTSGQVKTVGDLITWHEAGRGHRSFIGTPERLANDLIEWVETGAADGFNLMPAHLPGSLDLFVDQVVPRLQRAGHFRTEYATTTLRGNLSAGR